MGWLPRGNNSVKAKPPDLLFLKSLCVQMNKDLTGGVVRETGSRVLPRTAPRVRKYPEEDEGVQTTERGSAELGDVATVKQGQEGTARRNWNVNWWDNSGTNRL